VATFTIDHNSYDADYDILISETRFNCSRRVINETGAGMSLHCLKGEDNEIDLAYRICNEVFEPAMEIYDANVVPHFDDFYDSNVLKV